ncbi:hypothetical protein PF001_g15822 [Phytophthora fragariae]|uniref:Uncharacterized protein n=1 Tax=Phytophthora fragariae TaxID=53985 RepID=A0A6A3U3V7_9STRA|nr:hypothetical protein PF003_g18663 [Phytophthora fragariae]KAE8939284.1 hypothetical protein PF009_g10864 [Phytophthora fragariae]KAE9146171.1 hypothetical protein PF006_g9040 [Phytophthora fragariae]KAE9298661.1 hypothetical protein PF001_g15822 [Phytophthora fragariae]
MNKDKEQDVHVLAIVAKREEQSKAKTQTKQKPVVVAYPEIHSSKKCLGSFGVALTELRPNRLRLQNGRTTSVQILL